VAERFVFTVDYDEAVLRAAERQIFIRSVLLENTWASYGLMVALAFVALIWFYRDKSVFLSGFFTGTLVMMLVVIFGWGWNRRRRLRTWFKRTKSRRVTYRVADEGMGYETGATAGQTSWSAFTKIWKLKHVWILTGQAAGAITLPLKDVPPEALAFISSKIASQ
jgi:hypothetical protein